jgi:hypothetical protein
VIEAVAKGGDRVTAATKAYVEEGFVRNSARGEVDNAAAKLARKVRREALLNE